MSKSRSKARNQRQPELWTEERSAALPKARPKSAKGARDVPLANPSDCCPEPGSEPLKLSVRQSLAYYRLAGITFETQGDLLTVNAPIVLDDPARMVAWIRDTLRQ